MTLTKTRLHYLLFTIILLITAKGSSFAGGFPMRPGRLIISPSVSYFFANKQWDSLRVKKPFENDGRFTSLTYNIYAEYGINKHFALVALVPYSINEFKQTDYKSLNQGITDVETGIRYYIGNINYTYYFSVQATAITPLYSNTNLGYKESGAELKFSFAGSGHVIGKSFYFTFDNGLRQYFGSTGPFQDRYSGGFGITVDKKLKQQIAVSVGGFYSASSFKKFTPNQATNKNFAFNQASISYGYSFSRRVSVFANVGTFISGRNTGDGSSASLSFIVRPFK